MKKLALISIVLFIQFFWKGERMEIFAQVMSNYGSVIFSTNDTIYANGGILNSTNDQGTGIIGGTFRNSGQVYFTEDWTNDAGNAAFTNIVGINGASAITCYMIGGNQSILGTDETEFHNLRLRGSGIKQLIGVNAIVHDTFDLNTFEFATGGNKLFVTNTDPDAIEFVNGSGYVSSSDGGWLARNTNSPVRYMFPVGSSVGQFRYRPVEIAPVDNFPNQYAVRMANVDPGIEGYPTTQREATMSRVNEYYYHQITRESGLSPANITVYYDAAADGPVTGLAHWQNAPQWEDIVSNPDASNYGFTATTRSYWDFSLPSPAFALMKLINECGEMFVPTAFSPDGNGENDMECVYGKCIKDIYFAIYDRWGEKVFETYNMSQCWDGTYRGRQMNTAVFVYYMKATLTTGDEVVKKGNVTLLR